MRVKCGQCPDALKMIEFVGVTGGGKVIIQSNYDAMEGVNCFIYSKSSHNF